MAAKQLVASDVSRVHARYRVVHQEMHVEVIDQCNLTEGPVGLPELVSPFRQAIPAFFVLDQVTGRAIRWEQPCRGLLRIHLPADLNGADDAPNHFTRQRDVERSRLPAFRLRNVKHTITKIEVLDTALLDCVRTAAGEQQEKMELASERVFQCS